MIRLNDVINSVPCRASSFETHQSNLFWCDVIASCHVGRRLFSHSFIYISLSFLSHSILTFHTHPDPQTLVQPARLAFIPTVLVNVTFATVLAYPGFCASGGSFEETAAAVTRIYTVVFTRGLISTYSTLCKILKEKKLKGREWE